MKKLRQLLHSERGDITTSFVLTTFIVILFAMLGMEYGAALEKYDYALDLIQRATNTAVEYNIRDEYRSDRILLLDTAAAEQTLYDYIDSDITQHGRYTIHVDSVTCFETPPSLTVSGTGSFPTMLSGLGFSDVTFHFTVTSTNYDLDG